MSTFKLYVVGSVLLSGLAIYNSYVNYEQFYLMIEYLTTSKTHKTIILNAFFAVFALLFANFLNFFFGEIREIERIYTIEKVKRKIIEFALMLLVFREDILDHYFLAYFVGLISLSVLHWIATKRSEFLVVEGLANKSKYIKLLVVFMLLCWLDFLVLEYFYHHVYLKASVKGNHEQLLLSLFGFEFLILAMSNALPFVKYIINIFELVTYSHFESKATVFSILEFVFTMTKLIIELFLINFIRKNFQLPIHLLAEYIETIANLITTVRKFYSTITLIVRLNKLPNVTQRDIIEIDSICLICLHEIHSGKKIPCGHVFHYNCLKTWIQGNTNQFCPKCKKPIKIKGGSENSGAENQNNLNLNNMELLNQNLQNNAPILVVNTAEKPATLKDELETFDLKKVILENAIANLTMETAAVLSSSQSYLSRDSMLSLILKECSEGEKVPIDQLGSFEYGLPRKAVPYKSQKVELIRRKIKLLNNVLVSANKIDPFLFESELLRHLNFKDEVNVEKSHENLNPEQLERMQSLPQGLNNRSNSTVKLQADPTILRSVSSIVPQHIPKNLHQQHIDDTIEEALKRRQLLLEAAERRMQTQQQAGDNSITPLETKKTQ